MKKILSILLVLLMVVALVPLSASAADPTTTDLGLDGVYKPMGGFWWFNVLGGGGGEKAESLSSDTEFIIVNDTVSVVFSYKNQTYQMSGTRDYSQEGVILSGTFQGRDWMVFIDSNNTIPDSEYLFGGSIDNGGSGYGDSFELYVVKTGDVAPEPADYFTPFTGTAASNTAQYELAIAGFIDMELLPGDNVLTLTEIQSNTIAVVAYNNNNGIKRTMNQTTIEEMTVTVSGGQITQIYIMGRAQTSPGTLDRYSTTITL